ncbi:MAG: Lrp/AsnC family transcriptional regulator [Halobacteria archaeon]
MNRTKNARKPEAEILLLLEENARATPKEIARATGISSTQVSAIVSRLERAGALRGYRAVVDWEKAGVESVYALVDVRVGLDRRAGYDAIAKRIAQFPEVRSLQLVSGDYDLSVVVRGPSMKEVAAFIADKIATLEQVRGTVTHFTLKRFKENGELLFDAEKGKRLPVSA